MAVDLLATGKDDIAAKTLLSGKHGNIEAATSHSALSGNARSTFKVSKESKTFWDTYKEQSGASSLPQADALRGVVDDIAMAEMSDSDELDGFVKLRNGKSKLTRIGRNIRRYKKAKSFTSKGAKPSTSAVATSKAAEGATASATTTGATKAASAASVSAGGAASGGGAGAAVASLPAVIIICILFVIILIAGIIAGSEQDKIGGLTENESIVATLLKEEGFDEVHIAAIMGNWVCESDCNPRRVQCGFGYCRDANGNGVQDCEEQDNYPPELIEVGNAGYGLAQWSYPTRARALVNFAAEQGKPSGDAKVQVSFFANEFRHARKNFEAITDVEEACRWFHDVYERSADGAERLAKRVTEAKRIYAVLTGSGASGYVSMALAIANDDSHGYSMSNRTMSPDVDCSSFVYYSLILSGFSQDQLGSYPFTTYNMGPLLEGAGFIRIEFTGKQDLQPGDILVNPVKHTEIYYGEGMNIGAHGNYDGRSGDSSGQEVCLDSFWNFGITDVYRLAA